MTGEWVDATIESIASRIAMGPFGSDIKTDNFVAAGVPIIRGNNLTSGRFRAEGFVFLMESKADELANANAFPGDLVFTHRGTLGQVGLVPKEPFKRYVVSQSQMKLTCDPSKADRLFVYYFFRSPAGQHALLMNTSQTGVPAISRPVTSLKSIRLALPPLPEQRSIAQILGTLDDKIELNRRMNETLEATARAIFKDWFVDFGPTRAKQEGRAPYLATAIWSLFPDRLDDEGKPEGWTKVELGSVASDLRRGIAPAYIELGGVRVLNQKCIRNRQVDLSPSRRHDPDKRAINGRELNGGDILINSTGVGTLGRTAQFWGTDEPTIVDGHVTVVRADTKLVSAYYLGLNLTGRESEIEALGEGSTVQTELARTRIVLLPLLLPPALVQSEFEKPVRPLVHRMTTNARENKTLAATRDFLLPKLISGEVRVKDAEKIIGEAT